MPYYRHTSKGMTLPVLCDCILSRDVVNVLLMVCFSQLPVTPDKQTSVMTDQIIVIVYYMCDEPIPYSTKVHSSSVTLSQFKDLIVKKGNFRLVYT